mmetsp:Transcript_13097/g.24616  ORF Transcript_13097/g.24616 Transcript_13097/m.24616 type:complete len:290 (+) Transcript_13097:98-967(+)
MLNIPSSFISPLIRHNGRLATAMKTELQVLPAVVGMAATTSTISSIGSSDELVAAAQEIAVTMSSDNTQIFEPQVNLPALSAFLIIAVVFSLLQTRINNVRDASERRTEALNKLRQIKSAQLDSSSDSSSTRRPTEEQVNEAVLEYKSALEKELALRTVLPGVRIVAPNDPKRNESDIAAAKYFLGLDFDAKELSWMDNGSSSDDSSTKKKSAKQEKDQLLLQSRRRFDGKVGDDISRDNDIGDGLSNGNKAILLLIAIVQIGLLVILSFDPMTAENTFTVLEDKLLQS